MDDDRPLVLTLELDRDWQERFDAERARFFPPGRTAVGAHVTLFHALPAYLRDDVDTELTAASRRSPFPMAVEPPFLLGRGVAYRLRSPELQQLHRRLQESWRAHLTPQDRQGFRPHVTVQNKVTPELARATLAQLSEAFAGGEATATGLKLWRYDGGPWTAQREFRFG